MSDSTVLGPPVSVFEQPIQVSVDKKSLFTSLAESFARALYGKFVTGDSADVKDAVADAFKTVGLQIEPGPETIAWNLCRRALGTALVELIRPEQVRVLPEDAPETTFREEFVRQIDWTSIQLDERFFAHPEKAAFLRPVKAILEEWLVCRGMRQAEAHNVAQRLPSHFVFALHDEWRNKPNDYKPLEEHIRSPFGKTADRERAWLRYAAALRKECDASMFGESFGLAQVYVPLRAYHEEHLEKVRHRRSSDDFYGNEPRIRRTVVMVDEKLAAWVKAADKDDALRVLSGGPGSGKSSCAKIFAAKMAEQGRYVLLVPLHRVNYEADISKMVRQFVAEGQHLPFDPLETQAEDDSLLLLFDGLDELSMQGKSGAQAAYAFLHEVRRFLDACNHARLRVQVLVGGREIVVQEARAIIREPKRVLTLMPYFISGRALIDERVQGIEYEAAPGILEVDQRVSWWKGYLCAKGQTPSDMPQEFQRHELAEITAQPLLNYLVALSRELGTFDFSQDALRNRIYRDLLDRVYERAQRERKPHPGTSELQHDEFVELLEDIGLAVWHGNGRTATVKEIHSLCGQRLDQLLRRYENDEARVLGLLTAFYFRKHHQERNDEATFEFTHKSFGEYLTTRRIVRELRDLHEESKRVSKRGWDKKDALRNWVKVCGPTAIVGNLLPFLVDEVVLEDRGLVAQWQPFLQDLIGLVLREGMPMERLVPRPSYLDEMHHARNAEEALLVCLFACSQRTGEISSIRWPYLKSAAAWLHRLEGQATSETEVAHGCLGRLDLSRCNLTTLGLRFANLSGANLEGANLSGANLEGANLSGANLSGANLEGANLLVANLRGANLSGASLELARLERASLGGANLEGAGLFRANLLQATLERANLQGAKLQGAYLENAHLMGAKLERANLQSANLQGANLQGASLQGAYLIDANLFRANLFLAKLENASLERAELKGASLQRTNLIGANLIGANLAGANMAGANLQGATLQSANLEGTLGINQGEANASG